jgi:ZIP family zinc transporter
VIEAGIWAFFGQASLILGAWIALRWNVPRRALGLVAGFGAGTLVAAAAFELCVPAYRDAGRAVTAVALAAGAISFYAADRLVARHAPPGEHGSVGIALGALLDGIPESVAIAITLIGGSAVSGAMVAAVLASNLPEGMASTPGFRRAGWPTNRILLMWVGIAVAGAVAAMLGRVLLGDASDDVLGAINAFAAGTILTMIASVMLPTAFEDGREAVGLAFVLGFACLGGLSTLGA